MNIRRALWICGLAVLAASTGCASARHTRLQDLSRFPILSRIRVVTWATLPVSERTLQILRQHGLENDLAEDPQQTLARVQAFIEEEPNPETIYAYAELSYQYARRVQAENPRLALDLYGGAVLHAYQYLFDARFTPIRNPYDPWFRGACDLYNAALEGALRILCARTGLQPGTTYTIVTANGTWDLTCVLRDARWDPRDFGRFEFVSDYRLQGLRNHHVGYGLGVPLIAVRRSYPEEPSVAKYYPPNLSFPVTVFLRPYPHVDTDHARSDIRRAAALELYDPIVTSDVKLGNLRVPLQTDLTTPLATFLSNPALGRSLRNVSLLQPEQLMSVRPGSDKPIMGLYMVQPYDPNRIPVIFVHGWRSTPMTWIQMFNDLRSSPLIREHFQFWFYLYPTGQPFWISAAQLRRDLHEFRVTMDPSFTRPTMDQMVLIGHSMGGLVAELQTMESGQLFWSLVSDRAFEEVQADPRTLAELRDYFFFHPNPSVRRVITIATPHQGTPYSNELTQRVAGRLISIPQQVAQTQKVLLNDNRDLLRPNNLIEYRHSVDALAPDCPIFAAMRQAPRAPWTTYHNIIGTVSRSSLFANWTGDNDGIITRESGHAPHAASELVISAEHTVIHTHPLAILEVKRILLEHLREYLGQDGLNLAEARATTEEAAAIDRAIQNVPVTWESTEETPRVRRLPPTGSLFVRP